jgi:23S rRNA (uridine2552-2'-O)-methyltransferase
MKISDAKKDYYRKLSKEKGFRSRSAYKLIQLNNSYHILKPGYIVVDIGCAPGGWLQVAKAVVGYSGTVIGIDIEKVARLDGVTILQGDIQNTQTINLLNETLKGKANTLLSDVSPKVSGLWSIDHAQQISLSKSSLGAAKQILIRGGSAVLKVFEGEFLKEFKKDAENLFTEIHLTKPKASRQRSSELYMVCLGFKTSRQN